MSQGRQQAIEREARRLRDELQVGRRALLATSDEPFRRDVLVRLEQLLAGDELPRFENPDD